MTTPLARTAVSLAATAITLALGACAASPSRAAWDGTAAAAARPAAIRFDNQARVHVHVYLVGERREWLLGRVEPGARATLRVPEASLTESSGFVRLAVLTGDRMTLQAARDGRATVSIAQPASALLSQQWTLSQAQLASPVLSGAGAPRGRP